LAPLAEANLSPMARSFYADNKRVSNARIKHELGATLAYPDYRAGLAAILAAGGEYLAEMAAVRHRPGLRSRTARGRKADGL
jgi:hypothetical protein